MKIVITGANGYIGQNLVRHALTNEIKVIAIARSSFPEEWKGRRNLEIIQQDLCIDNLDFLGDNTIDCVIHLAAAMQPFIVDEEPMLLATQKLVNEMHHAGIKKLIGMSSLSVLDYESRSPLSVIDESVGCAENHQRMSKYSAVKALQENIFQTFVRRTTESCIIFRPGLVYDSNILESAHAGFIKKKIKILIDHPGQVPVVGLDTVSQAILLALKADISGTEIIHLVDDHLPTQKKYQAILSERCGLQSNLYVNWQLANKLINLLSPISLTIQMNRFMPEICMPQAYAARFKPFRYTNTKAKQLLKWKPVSITSDVQ